MSPPSVKTDGAALKPVSLNLPQHHCESTGEPDPRPIIRDGIPVSEVFKQEESST